MPVRCTLGDQIAITFVPSKRGTPIGMLRKVVLAGRHGIKGWRFGRAAAVEMRLHLLVLFFGWFADSVGFIIPKLQVHEERKG